MILNLILQLELMYVNYGWVEDYQWLVSNKSINVMGKIVIVRYGKIFCGDKVMEGVVQQVMVVEDVLKYLYSSL